MITEDGVIDHPCGNPQCLLGFIPNPGRPEGQPRNIHCPQCRTLREPPAWLTAVTRTPLERRTPQLPAKRHPSYPPRANDCYYHPNGTQDGCPHCRGHKIGAE